MVSGSTLSEFSQNMFAFVMELNADPSEEDPDDDVEELEPE